MPKNLTTEEFIVRAVKTHGMKYDYSNSDYMGKNIPISIICQKHGSFKQTPKNHLYRNQGCPDCGRENTTKSLMLSTDEFIRRARSKHGLFYDYSLVDYTKSRDMVIIKCPTHGLFKQRAYVHLSGKGCNKCGLQKSSKSLLLHEKEFLSRCADIHDGKYDYSLVNYRGVSEKIQIVCPEHGVFWQIANDHKNGSGCAKCVDRKGRLKSTEDFVEEAGEIHPTYDYSRFVYTGSKQKGVIVCPVHGAFWQIPNANLRGVGCPRCRTLISKPELEIGDFITQLGVSIQRSNRGIIAPKELDIFVPKHNLALEVCGLYWHSEGFCDSNYHIDKLLQCKKQNVRLLTIFEDEWRYKSSIVKSKISHLLKQTTDKVFARNCRVESISYPLAAKFMNDNHLQGEHPSSINYGLWKNDELVSVMTFCKPRFSKKYDLEMIRFCNKINTSVVGSAGKLLSQVTKKFPGSSIVSYADRRWSDGDLYQSLGFTLSHHSKPAYWYVSTYPLNRESRIKYQKHKLCKDGYDSSLTEREIMQQRGYHRIWDCGNSVWVLNFNTEMQVAV